MALSITHSTFVSPTPSLVMVEETEKQTDALVSKVVEEVFGKLSIVPNTVQDLISDYIFTELTPFIHLRRIYNAVGIHFAYIPKPIHTLEESSVCPLERELRIREGEDNILSRLAREFEHAQIAMEREEDKAFKYVKASESYPAAQEIRIGSYTVGVSSFIGVRHSMEDTHIVSSFDLTIQGVIHKVPLFGVFDGHGGLEAAKYMRYNLKEALQNVLGTFNSEGLHHEGIWNALKMTCVSLNLGYRSLEKSTAGTTVLFAIELYGKIWIVNTGDSRAILNNGGTFIQLTEDAKPKTPRFKKGITDRGGSVVFNRLGASLAVARAVGDPEFGYTISSRSKITMLPHSFFRPGSDLLLACDGFFDVSSTKQILKTDVQLQHLSPGSLAREMNSSAFVARSQDNLTMIVVRFS